MNTYIALFRGINVGGSHLVKMADLKQLMEENTFDPATGTITVDPIRVEAFRSNLAYYTEVFSAGNSDYAIPAGAVSDPARLAKKIAGAIAKLRGFEPRVLVLTGAELERAAAANPFPEAAREPKSVHLFFLAARPAKPDLKAIEEIKAKTERFALKGSVFYMHTPAGLGKSKLAVRVERLLGVDATARNWSTVTALLEIAQAAPYA